MKVLFGMAYRQTIGFVESLLCLIGLNWAVPDFSTLSRRQRTLAVNIPYRGAHDPLHLLIDSTSIKVEGEGEWNARRYGGPKRRVWRNIHFEIDEQTLEVRAVEIIGSHIGDALAPPNLLNQIPANEVIGSFAAHGAYYARKCHDAIADRALLPLSRPAKRQVVIDRHRGCSGQKRVSESLEIPRSRHLEKLEWLPPPEPRRDQDALVKLLGQRLMAGTLPAGHGSPNPHRPL